MIWSVFHVADLNWLSRKLQEHNISLYWKYYERLYFCLSFKLCHLGKYHNSSFHSDRFRISKWTCKVRKSSPVSGMDLCACACDVVLQKEEKQDEIRQPYSTLHVENERVRERGWVGNEMEQHWEGEQTSAFLSGGPSVEPDIFHWWDTFFVNQQ